ncbi:MAG TPA: hypothetical protein VHV51_05585 [Polyangiaceae bacterium]|jgi:hypothetical protein|nr:hypothetical protein [Polyangiaceae bacterium]
MRSSAVSHPIPEREPAPRSARAPANDTGRGLWLANLSELELTLIQVARSERPRQELRTRVLKACGVL